jgi:hypothetical protein
MGTLSGAGASTDELATSQHMLWCGVVNWPGAHTFSQLCKGHRIGSAILDNITCCATLRQQEYLDLWRTISRPST